MVKEKQKQIIDCIMEKYGFENYEVKPLYECKNWWKRISNQSWCDYRENGKTVIYLKENELNNLEDIIVAAHEASHVINYQNGKTNFKKLKLWNKICYAAFISEIIASILFVVSIFYLYFNLSIFILFNFYVCLASFCIDRYFKMYIIDENNADSLTEREIQPLSSELQIDEDSMKNRIQERIEWPRKSCRTYFFASLIIPAAASLLYCFIVCLSIFFV